MDNLLEIKNLSAGYVSGKKVTEVLRNVNLSLRCGMLVSLLGANGAGKSTLLRTVSAVQTPLSGEVLVAGKPIGSYGRKQLSRLVSIVSTERTQSGGLTVEELVGLGRQPHTGIFGRLGEHDRAVTRQAMVAVGIGHKADAFVAELSDGERQKAMIARALAQESPIIILDEPTSFLDVESRIEILRLLHRLTREEGKAVLLSSHDIAQSLVLSDRLWLLSRERTIVEGVTEDLVLDGQMNSLFTDGHLRFDRLTGEFTDRLPDGTAVSVAASTPELEHWIGNALRRNGCTVVADAPLKIEAETPGRIHLGGCGRALRSVEELIAVITKK